MNNGIWRRIWRNVYPSGIVLLLALLFTELALNVRDSLLYTQKWYWGMNAVYQWQLESPPGERLSSFKGPLRVALNPLLGFHHVPGSGNEYFSINEYGLRGESLPRIPPPGRKRIAMLGGSTVFGLGLPSDADTLAAQLAAQLESTDVLNGGVVKYSTGNEYALTTNLLLGFSPDVILALHGWNDFHEFLLMHDPEKDPFFAGFHQVVDQVRFFKEITSANPLVRISYGVATVLFPKTLSELRGIIRVRAQTPLVTERLTQIDLLAERFVDAIARFEKLAAQEGFTYISVLQPDLNEAALGEQLPPNAGYLQQYAMGYRIFRREVMRRAKARGLPVYDMGAENKQFRAAHFIDTVHFSAAGARFAAALLRTYLCEEAPQFCAEEVQFDEVVAGTE